MLVFERLVKEHWNQSTDIYAKPEKTQMVKSDRGEMQENMVVYANADTLRGDPLSGNTH